MWWWYEWRVNFSQKLKLNFKFPPLHHHQQHHHNIDLDVDQQDDRDDRDDQDDQDDQDDAPVTEILLLTSLWTFSNCAGCQNVSHLRFYHYDDDGHDDSGGDDNGGDDDDDGGDDDSDDDDEGGGDFSHHSAVVLVASLCAIVATENTFHKIQHVITIVASENIKSGKLTLQNPFLSDKEEEDNQNRYVSWNVQKLTLQLVLCADGAF